MIEHRRLVDAIVARLHQQIEEGQFRPGQRLPAERTLCALYGVGRTTVREALATLATQGLVRRTPRGAVVVDPSARPPAGVDLAALAAQTTIRDLYEVRKLLEVRVARWAALRATAEDLERLRAAVWPPREVAEGTSEPNLEFHDALVVATQNPVLNELYTTSRTLLLRLPFFWRLLEPQDVRAARSDRHDLARRWHERILRAIEARDADEAAGAMFQHLDIMEKDLLARLRPSDSEAVLDSRPAQPGVAPARF